MTDRNEFEELQMENMLLKERLGELSAPPYRGASLLEMGTLTARVAVEGSGVYEVALPSETGLAKEMRKNLSKGSRVVVNPQNMSIVDFSEFELAGTQIVTVEEVEGEKIRVQIGGAPHFVDHAIDDIKPGDEILLDPTSTLAIERFERTKSRYNLETVPIAPWKNIGGLEDTIAEIKDEVELPYLNKKIFARYGRVPAKGILLYGPPGCGKTMIAKSIAYNLSIMNGCSKGHFISIRGPEILEKWVGNAEATLRGIYQSARESAAETGAPTVVFFDEAEAIMKKRGTGISSDITDILVPQLNSLIDGINSNDNVITVLATNREDIIDPAILRPGRVDLRIQVPRPNEKGTREIFNIYLKDKPLKPGQSSKKLSSELSSHIFDTNNIAYEVHGPEGPTGSFLYQHFVSGAMIRGIIDLGIKYAIKRELAGQKTGRGLSSEDLNQALDRKFSDGFAEDLTKEDWEAVFNHNGKPYQELFHRGVLTLHSQGNERRGYS